MAFVAERGVGRPAVDRLRAESGRALVVPSRRLWNANSKSSTAKSSPISCW